MDGYYSLVRYFLNNFADGFRQDAFNLFLGHYEVFHPASGLAKLPLPTHRRQSIQRRFLPFFLAFSVSMSVLCLLFPSGAFHRCPKLFFVSDICVLCYSVFFKSGECAFFTWFQFFHYI